MSQRSCNECAGRSRAECFLTLSLFSLCPAPKLKVAENSLAWEVIVGAVFAQPGPDHPDPNSHPSVGVGMVSAVTRPGGQAGWRARLLSRPTEGGTVGTTVYPPPDTAPLRARHWAALVSNVISATLQCAVLTLCVLTCVLSCFTP